LKKRMGLILLVSCLVVMASFQWLPTAAPVSAATLTGGITVELNGEKLVFDQPPIVENGRTLVPMRAIFEALGASVEWYEPTQTVTATRDGIIITMSIGSNVLMVNGESIQLEVPAKLVGVRTVVPIRAIAEGFGADVQWDQGTQTVYITTDAYRKGIITTNSFQSKYLGFKFTATSDFVMATQDELDELIEESSDFVYADVGRGIIDYVLSNTVYEMMASDPTGDPNVIVIVEKLYFSNTTEAQYLSALKSELVEPFADMGFPLIFHEDKRVNVAGQIYTMLPAESPGELRQDYYVKKKDNRMITIIVTYTDETIKQMEALLSLFEEWKE